MKLKSIYIILVLFSLMFGASALNGSAAAPAQTNVAIEAAAEPTQVIDRAAGAGIVLGTTPTWDVCVGDWNGDGRDDFFVSRHMLQDGALFVQNLDGTFSRSLQGVIAPKVIKRTEPRHTGVDRHGCTFGDFDGNDQTDLYTTAGRYASNRVKHSEIDNELFMQKAPGIIEDWAIRAAVNEPCHRSRHPLVIDLNGDDAPDMIVGAQKERDISTDSCNPILLDGTREKNPYIEQSHAYINLGDSDLDGVWDGMRLAPEFLSRETNLSAPNIGVGMLIEWDQNRDGRKDVLSLGLSNRRPTLLRHNGSSLNRVTFSGSSQLPYVNHVAIGDVTGDTIDDFVYSDNAGFAYSAGTATGLSTTPVRIGLNLPTNADGWKLALGDINGDGDIDVYGMAAAASGTTGNPNDVMFMNQGVDSTGRVIFTQMAAPSTVGASNDVATIMVGNRAQFVVLNGGNEEKEVNGLVQLIATANEGVPSS